MAASNTSFSTAVRKKVSVSFANIFSNGHNADGHCKLNLRQNTLIASSLPLQMLLYFNIYYFPFWLVTHIVTTNIKMSQMGLLFQVLTVFLLVVMVALEMARLYLGYIGNLNEKVPELAGSWLITVVLQLPALCFFLVVAGNVRLPAEVVVDSIMAAFLLGEILVGVHAIRAVSKQQAIRFRVQQMEMMSESFASSPAVDPGVAVGAPSPEPLRQRHATTSFIT